MIHVTRLNHTPVVLNSDLIEHVETTPDTVISLTNGEKMMVLESADEIIDRVVRFRRSILSPENLEGGNSEAGAERVTARAGNDIHGGR
jgi:flagellar protein FlbD